VTAFDNSFREGLNIECTNNVKDLDLKQTSNGDIANLIPDSVLKVEDHFVHIEMDMNSEKLSVIKDKVKRYIELCNNNPEEQHSIVFSVVDGSFEEGLKIYTEAPVKRIRNIKEALLSMNGLHQPNLRVYVMPFARSHDLVSQLLKGEKPFQERVPIINIETVADILSYANESFGYIFEPIDSKELLPKDTPPYYMPDRCYTVNNKAGTVEHNVMFTFLEEGCVQCFDKLNFLHHIMGQTKGPVRKIIALYSNPNELANDIPGSYKYVLFGDGETLSETTEENPTFLRSISPLRRGETSYEGV